FVVSCCRLHPRLPSFPTRRSSDLPPAGLPPDPVCRDGCGVLPPHPHGYPSRPRNTAGPSAGHSPRQTPSVACRPPHGLGWFRVKIGRAHVELQSRENLVCRLLLEK